MKSLIFILLTLMTSTAFALPKAPHDALKVKLPKTLALLENQLQYDFEGIVKLSNCSGALVIFSGMPEDAKALVMTNGHCIQKPGGYLEPGEVWVDYPIKRSMKLFDARMKLHSIEATKITYATMTSTDLAFYELTQSFAEIKAMTGVSPLLLDAGRPFVGDSIEIISGYWDRGWSCEIDAFVFGMREAKWSWTDSIRYTSTCTTMGGTSGSPIIRVSDRRVVGVNNTSNEKGEVCTINNPCEVSEAGEVSSHQGVRYGQQTYNVYTCLTPDFRLELSLPGCDLPKVGKGQ